MQSFIGHLSQVFSMVPAIATDNRRNARRFPAHHPAQIMLGPDAMIPCTVRDISTGGARIALKPQMDLPETFELFIAAHDLQVRRARVCWRRGGFAGIAFSSDDADATMTAETPRTLTFEDCLDQAAMPAHLAAKPARKNLKLWQTNI
jgi:PilZ domain